MRAESIANRINEVRDIIELKRVKTGINKINVTCCCVWIIGRKANEVREMSEMRESGVIEVIGVNNDSIECIDIYDNYREIKIEDIRHIEYIV